MQDRAGLPATIVMAGLAGASIDGIYASIMGIVRGIGVMRVWQGVASGWIGGAARDGGVTTAALGFATHIGIALIMATVYVLALHRIALLRTWRWPAAVAYGLALYGAMYLVVLPLRWPGIFPRWDGLFSVTDIAAHVGVALAIAAVARQRRE
ncbi:hypothetical protein [Niveispirillum cyanobacteriorum]|uniref:Uncharacterized protein n=1 Tax=Niveispirillum cyanobacteriorum TaxID=1612173 RepID=A0A2K9NIW7_9PROT|nr:hypothetical protein [Niveispirillum cyanobacteriorum]AUN33047.1 hypothetical protein C0V82_21810 [Niveispirillum cyanobacteriorum]GGE45894.1 hypothetical protein GCM10011317_00380 [Niveispirillum cyanobacteriorum]